MNKNIIVALIALVVVSGCSSRVVMEDDTVSLSDQGWSLVVGSGVTDEVVIASLSLLDDATINNDTLAFSAIINDRPLKRLANGFSLDVNYTEGYADDYISYRYSGSKQKYVFPYAKENKKRLEGLECEGEKNFDTILCYMPRLDAIYGPFVDVFAQGGQLIYSVTSYQNLNTQHILSLSDQIEFPYMDQLYLLYYNEEMDRVFVTKKNKQGSFVGLSYFENRKKTSLFDDEFDMVFFDGKYIYVAQTDYSTELNTLYIYEASSGNLIHTVDSLDIGERAEFRYKDNTLLVYYVDVSFVEEKEFYYVMSFDIADNNVNWKVSID